jgi:hypothetical protein
MMNGSFENTEESSKSGVTRNLNKLKEQLRKTTVMSPNWLGNGLSVVISMYSGYKNQSQLQKKKRVLYVSLDAHVSSGWPNVRAMNVGTA